MKNSVTILTGKEKENIRAMGKIFGIKWWLVDATWEHKMVEFVKALM